MRKQEGKSLHVELPPGWHEKLKVIAAKEGRKVKEVVAFALKPIIRSGKSGMNGNGGAS